VALTRPAKHAQDLTPQLLRALDHHGKAVNEDALLYRDVMSPLQLALHRTILLLFLGGN
jgi:hypothetical protein